MTQETGATQGMFNPCHYVNAAKQQRTWVHGDDFAVLIRRSQVTEFVAAMRKQLLVKVRAVLGPRPTDDHEIRILNRIVTWKPPGRAGGYPSEIWWEADPRHVQILAKEFGFDEKTKPVAAPGKKELASPLEGPPVAGEDGGKFGSVCMRLMFLALDRPDIIFTGKEAARAMSCRTITAWQSLKHQVRYLIGAPRLVWVYRQQAPQKAIVVASDSNYAGCLTTRKSTTCVVVKHGCHVLKVGAQTQGTLALSVGESEFFATVKGAATVIGMQSVAKDWGMAMEAILETDSSSAKGILSRRGAGKIRHLDTPLLWVQQRVARKQLRVNKVAGAINVADIGTKILDGPRIRQLMKLMNMRFTTGQSKLALKAA